MGFRFTEIVYNDNKIISSFIAISLGWQYVYALIFLYVMLLCKKRQRQKAVQE